MADTGSNLDEPLMLERITRRSRIGNLSLAGLLFGIGCGVLYFDPWRARVMMNPITMMKTPAQTGLGTMHIGGYKAGMASFMQDDGSVLGGTVIYLGDGAVVTQRRTDQEAGLDRIQLGYQPVQDKKLKMAERGHLRKAGAPPLKKLIESTVHSDFKAEPGERIQYLDKFNAGDKVSVIGTSIGKGFQGGIKRWNMHRGLMTHGSKHHRAPGSIGMRYSGGGGRVVPKTRMPGRMGNKRVTMKTQVIDMDVENQALIVKGGVPGHSGGFLRIKGAGLPDDGIPKMKNGRAFR